METIPVFRRRQPKNTELLHEDDACTVYRWGDIVRLTVDRRWDKRCRSLADKFGVDGLVVSISPNQPLESLQFVRDLPGLRWLSVTVHRQQADLSPVQGLSNLQHLRVHWEAEAKVKFEFSTLPSLTECRINFQPGFESVLGCAGLKILGIFDAWDTEELDLTRLERLGELDLNNCPKLRRLRLHDSAALRALEVVQCRKLAVEWRRVGRDLEYLSVARGLGFRLNDVVAARKLKLIQFTQIKLPPLDFLRELPELKAVDVFPPKASPENEKIIREINAAGGFGPNLFVPRPEC